MPPISYREKKEIVKTVKVQDVTNATTKFCKPCPELQKISVPVSVHKGKPLTPILQNSADSKVKPISHKKEMNIVISLLYTCLVDFSFFPGRQS